jgi:(p)ppGpp synthase/HD superfamily hydrolase
VSTLELAIAIAAEAHAGQADEAGAPFVLHPLRVMLQMSNDTDRIVAVLHDVLEGCAAWSSGRLRSNGFSEEIIGAIEALTRYPWESEETFIGRAGRNEIARRVKLADLADHRDVSRIGVASQTDRERAAKLQHQIDMLEAA